MEWQEKGYGVGQKDKVFEGKIAQDSIFKFKDLYKFAYEWLGDEQYKVIEKKYKEKVTPDGKEIEFEWAATRKITDYIRFEIDLKWRLLRLQEVEITQNGEKIKMDKGSIEIKATAFLERDYEGKWGTSPFKKFMRGIYDTFLLGRTRIEAYQAKLFSEVDSFIAQVKSYLTITGSRGR